MNTIKVDKKNLIATLKVNREQHRKTFIQAVKDFRVKCKNELLIAAKKVPNTTAKVSLDKSESEKSVYVSLSAPTNSLAEYDRTIEMLEMDLVDTVDLTAQEFSRYVKDQWEWKDQFIAMSNSYAISANEFCLPKKGGAKKK